VGSRNCRSNDCSTIGSTSQLLTAATISPTTAPATHMMTVISKFSARRELARLIFQVIIGDPS
jgi:hypothetical protein